MFAFTSGSTDVSPSVCVCVHIYIQNMYARVCVCMFGPMTLVTSNIPTYLPVCPLCPLCRQELLTGMDPPPVPSGCPGAASYISQQLYITRAGLYGYPLSKLNHYSKMPKLSKIPPARGSSPTIPQTRHAKAFYLYNMFKDTVTAVQPENTTTE